MMESRQTTYRSYALALLELVGRQEGADDDNPPFGFAMRQVKRATIYHQTAHRLLHALIEYSPAPEAVAKQFLTELARCENTEVVTLVNNLNGDSSVSPDQWAADVNRELNENDGNITPVTELASYYLTHLVIAFRNPGRTPPQDTLPPTPDGDRTEQNRLLLDSATISRDQAALTKLIIRRDGPSCLITGDPFEGDERIIPYCTHIIPFSFHDKALVLAAIEMFTDKELDAVIIRHFINDPVNAINLDAHAHDAMDRRLAWGIEAKPVGNECKYYFRVVKSNLPSTIKCFIKEGDEIRFGMGEDGPSIALPDPRLCNLHLAIARVFAASGFADVYEKYQRDEDLDEGTGNLGEDLTRRLQSLSVLG